MNLMILDSELSVIKLEQTDAIPSWALDGEFFSITRTYDELSIVCSSANVPSDVSMDIESNWKCLKVEGIWDFSLTGILAALANPLSENNISIFAISTHNTDYLLIKGDSIEKAKSVLENAGHQFL